MNKEAFTVSEAKRSRSGATARLTNLLFATAAALALTAAPAAAATFTVDNTDNSGAGSLRAAINAANANANPPHTIDATAVSGTIDLQSELPDLERSMTIDGPGADQLTVRRDAGGAYRIFTIRSPEFNTFPTVELIGLTIANSAGGGIASRGTLTVRESAVTDNSVAGFGGGIFSQLALTVIDSTISGNTAGAVTTGGGIDHGGRLRIENSTITGNTANGSSGGGGVWNSSVLSTIQSSTIAANTNDDADGAANLYVAAGLTTLLNTIIADPLGGSANCIDAVGLITSGGHNLASDGSCNLNATSDQPNSNPLLGPLADNGGATLTMLPAPGGPAIDQGHSRGLTTDQRGFDRPVDNPDIANEPDGDGADIGAVELQVTVSPDPTTRDDCKNGGWQDFGFSDQGQCIRFVKTGKDSR